MESIIDKTNIANKSAKVFLKKEIDALVDSIIVDEVLRKFFGIRFISGQFADNLDEIKSLSIYFPYEVNYNLGYYKEMIYSELPEIIEKKSLPLMVRNLFFSIVKSDSEYYDSLLHMVFDRTKEKYQYYCEHVIKDYLPHFSKNCGIQNRIFTK